MEADSFDSSLGEQAGVGSRVIMGVGEGEIGIVLGWSSEVDGEDRES